MMSQLLQCTLAFTNNDMWKNSPLKVASAKRDNVAFRFPTKLLDPDVAKIKSPVPDYLNLKGAYKHITILIRVH